MNKLILFFGFWLIYFLLSCANLNSQSKFIRTIGGSGNEYSYYNIIQNSDGGYTLAGFTDSYGSDGQNIYITRLDSSGMIVWAKSFGGTGWEYAYSIIPTFDGGYAATGNTFSVTESIDDIIIIKLNSSGNIQWCRKVGGPNSESAVSMIQTSDSGYAILGSTSSYGAGGLDMIIIKLNSAGTFLWSKTIGGTNYDVAGKIVQTPDGGLVVTGTTKSYSSGDFDILVVKIDQNGSLLWAEKIGGPDTDKAFSLTKTFDGGFAVSGVTNSYGILNSGDTYIIKLDSSGSLQWSRTIGGSAYESGNSIIQTIDGGYAITGSTLSFGAGDYDMYLIKLNSSGTLQWSKTYGGTHGDYANSVIQTTDRGFIIGGFTFSFGNGLQADLMIVKTDSSGNTCGYTTSPASISDSGGTVISVTPVLTSPVPVITAPVLTVNSGGISTNVCDITEVLNLNQYPGSYELFQNYPNPFNPVTKIKFDIPYGFPLGAYGNDRVMLKIFDVLGKEIATLVNERLQPGSYEVVFDGSNYSSGIYFYKLIAGDFISTKKMLLIK